MRNLDNVETVKRAIEINAGLAILPASTVVTESERKQLVTYQVRRRDIIDLLQSFIKETEF